MSIIWTDKNGLRMPNPSTSDPKTLGAAKNYLRKHSRKINTIYERAGL